MEAPVLTYKDTLRTLPNQIPFVQAAAYNFGRKTKVALREPKPVDPDDDATTDVDPALVASAPSETVAFDDTLEAMERDAPHVTEAQFAADPEIEQPAAAPARNVTAPLMDLNEIDFSNLASEY